MTAETFFQLFNQYGLILVCAVVFCEYMNLPGFPAGVIMPCVGVLIARSELSLPLTVFLSVIAGVLGSLVIYAVCYWGGEPVMEKLFGRSKKFKSLVRKCHEFIDAQHGRGLAIIRVIPCIRTIVSIPAEGVEDIREDDDTFHTIVGLHDIFITCYKNREMLFQEGLPGNK